MVCCEALEIMTLCFALLPTALDTLSKEKAWQTYIIDLLLHCHSKYVCIWLLIYVCVVDPFIQGISWTQTNPGLKSIFNGFSIEFSIGLGLTCVGETAPWCSNLISQKQANIKLSSDDVKSTF